MSAKDDAIDFEDKLAVVAAYAESKEDVGGVCIIGIHRD